MNKCIICNSIEYILLLLCFWCLKIHQLLYTLKCIHYYSCNFRLFMFYYKSNSMYKTFTTCNPCIYVDTPLSYSLITNTATQFLGGNLLRNLLGILHTWDTVWFEQYSIKNFNVFYIHIFALKTYFLLWGWIATSHQIILLVGRGNRNWTIT